ncbi:HNH endonuclease [Candidatus Bathyarchaeota archaeon]|nr:HNH endonuclease [Candidatus Bathyarchaeota archaeon]
MVTRGNVPDLTVTQGNNRLASEGMPGTPAEASQGQADQPCEGGSSQSAQVQPSQPALPATSQGQPASQPIEASEASQGQPAGAKEVAASSLLGGPSGPVQLALSGQPWGGENAWEREDHEVTKFSWERVKVLKGKNRERAVVYLAGRDGVRCTEGCRLIVSDPLVLNVHHINGIPENNMRWNLRLVDQVCNSRVNSNLRAKQVRVRLSSLVHPEERERETAVSATAGVTAGVVGVGVRSYPSVVRWSNREGEKHDRERALWDAWILNQLRDPVGGPVKGPFEGREMLGLMQLAYMAPRALGLGSWKTYLGYIHEDHYGGPLEIQQIGGRKYVMLRKDWIEKHGGIVPKMEEDDDAT